MSDIFLAALVSGAFAGFAVDVSLYPIDTLKTRLQSPKGFLASGGFTGIYRGLGSVAIGSAPGAALFFTVYETSKFYTPDNSLGHMMSASFGEIAACLVRVPTENVKTRMQINSSNSSLSKTVKQILKGEGVRNMYNGFGITLMREIPFAFIQFPIYERMKLLVSTYQSEPASPIQSAICGSFGGAIAAAVTTPLDVVKTRLMVGEDIQGVKYTSVGDTVKRIVRDEGRMTLLNGIQPRIMWISIGGFVFFGAYEACKGIVGNVVGSRKREGI
ncbi:hypothetical protein TrLO_g15608 [Triparma laevis f. longispina]|uniref:S-adenosylmethionine transporter n=1 Tax=Triparma laevis f. longispina TaxID=1714387 RepID=A0A9W7FR78_9STRA|nr:hypothetical protein TrLO_g15608 [Triparma laevis f. longispina]